tara:strand:- start:6419 stop:6799 length:381 start_codon:yes stop_codon:yes gene_type:complete
MKTRSAKAKGRRLQDWVRTQLVKRLRLPADTDLVTTAIMGENGMDVKVVSTLRNKWPFSIECKNRETFTGIYKILEQSRKQDSNLIPLAFLKMNRQKPLVVLEAETFLEIYFNDQDNNEMESPRDS